DRIRVDRDRAFAGRSGPSARIPAGRPSTRTLRRAARRQAQRLKGAWRSYAVANNPRLKVRTFLSIGAIVVLTLALLPFQWIAARMKLPMRRRIPTFYHDLVCRILGVRIRTVGRRADEQPLLIVANHTSW